jgi:DNA-binding beta-propeller fold protein YncE
MTRGDVKKPKNEVTPWHNLRFPRLLTVIFAVSSAHAIDFRPPAGIRYAQVTAAGSVLPGGRSLKAYGTQIETGPGPYSLSISPKGTVATADTGFERSGITIIEPPGRNPWHARHIWARTPHSSAPEIADPDWKSVAAGIVFDSEKSVWVAEGSSGKIRQIDIGTGDHKRIVNLNGANWNNSFTGDLAFDSGTHLLYAVDPANARLAIIDSRAGRVISSVALEAKPFAVALSPDGATAWISEANSVCAIDVHNPLKPVIRGRVAAASPESLVVTEDRVFVSSPRSDSITVISSAGLEVLTEISLGIPSLEKLPGVLPAGLAYDPLTKWLLVAEAGINALGVVDTEKNEVIGHLPAGWMPVKVAIAGDRVYIANARGRGAGPSPRRAILELGEPPIIHRGSISTFIMPDRNEILSQTGTLFSYDGLVPYMREPPKPPAAIQHVVLIVKGNRTFDEVMGDVTGNAAGFAGLARYGMHGRASGGRTQFSVQDAPITPNLHAIAQRWVLSDNFYVEGESKGEADIWLGGGVPDLRAESALHAGRIAEDSSRLVDHLQTGGVKFRVFDESSPPELPDQERANLFIAEMNRRYGSDGEPLPGLLVIHLPNDRAQAPRPQAAWPVAYPYEASFVADNDLASGRIIEFLSRSPWWKSMTVFITENDTEGSLDHLDAHRTLLLAAGPWVKRNYVSHVNTSFPGLLRTIFELLGLPPLNLQDATAASLQDIFTEEPDFNPFDAVEPDRRIFDPARLQQ